MKIIHSVIFGIAIFFLVNTGKCQSLSFSQVLIVTSVEDTVPPGKVWKVESAMASSNLNINTGTTSHQQQNTRIIVSGNTVYVTSTWGSSYGSGMIQTTKLPIWLPAGERIAASTNVSAISVIEFDVIP